MFGRLFWNWKKSKAHLLFLSKFLNGNSPSHYEQNEGWQTALNESPSAAIKRFLKDGVLGPAGTKHILASCYTVTDLKGMLRERNLKLSGKKDELVTRLIGHDLVGMQDAARQHDVLICIGEGAEIARNFIETEQQERAELEQQLLALLQKTEFRTASEAVAKYEAAQVFPRGLGIDWSEGGASMEPILRDIYDRTPSILAAEPERELKQLRVAAAMMELTGQNRANRWLPDDLQLSTRMDKDAAARMLLFHAYHLRRMQQYQEVGIRKVEISGVDDGLQCAACRKIDGKVFTPEKLPELPYPKCTCELGCRCTTVVAEFD